MDDTRLLSIALAVLRARDLIDEYHMLIRALEGQQQFERKTDAEYLKGWVALITDQRRIQDDATKEGK